MLQVLERNMSLSSQYLEELSRRYKKQVEEMQHLLEKTIVTLREEAQRKDLRNKQLEDRLDNLTIMMESLVAERHNWILSIYCLMTSTLVLLGIYFFCRKSTTYIDSARENKETTEVLRRKSIDVVTHRVPVKKKRRPSDQALKIVRCSALSAEEDKHKSSNQRQKKRKKRNLMRSNSISNIKDNSYMTSNKKSDEDSTVDWIERNHQIIEDIPFALEESDHTTLEAYPLENELMRLNSTNETPTALSSRMKRISSQNNESHNVSHEEISNSTEKNSLNDKITDSTGEPVRKEKRSFKKLFKKVF